jgi:hypothetical protein
MEKISSKKIIALLRKFRDHLQCWTVDRSLGSMVYFEFGEKWRYPLEETETVVGSATLVLEADEWVIFEYDRKIITSEQVNDEDMAKISSLFIGKSLVSLEWKASRRQCRASFSKGVYVECVGDADVDLCTLTLPNGTIIGCSPESGFYSDGSRSEPHARAYEASHR